MQWVQNSNSFRRNSKIMHGIEFIIISTTAICKTDLLTDTLIQKDPSDQKFFSRAISWTKNRLQNIFHPTFLCQERYKYICMLCVNMLKRILSLFRNTQIYNSHDTNTSSHMNTCKNFYRYWMFQQRRRGMLGNILSGSTQVKRLQGKQTKMKTANGSFQSPPWWYI